MITIFSVHHSPSRQRSLHINRRTTLATNRRNRRIRLLTHRTRVPTLLPSHPPHGISSRITRRNYDKLPHTFDTPTTRHTRANRRLSNNRQLNRMIINTHIRHNSSLNFNQTSQGRRSQRLQPTSSNNSSHLTIRIKGTRVRRRRLQNSNHHTFSPLTTTKNFIRRMTHTL